jgi:hypothetical protein
MEAFARGVGDRCGRPLRHLADGTGQDKYVVHVRPDEWTM